MLQFQTLQWRAVHRRGRLPDVVPLHDFRDHKLGKRCWCRPQIDHEIVIHNALDRRELYETGRLRLS